MKHGIIPFKFTNILKNPGDKASIEVTKTHRMVGKIDTHDFKMSQTYYPTTGTVVETRSYKHD